MTRFIKITVPIVGLLLLIMGLYAYWQHRKLFPSTNDAYVQAHTIYIAPQITGKVSYLAINNHQYVKKGQLLLKIDAKPFQIAAAKAKAIVDETEQQIMAEDKAVQVAQAIVKQRQAELINAQTNTQRVIKLATQAYLSKSQSDEAVKNLRVAKAAVASAQKQLEQAIAQRGDTSNRNAKLRQAQSAYAQALLNMKYTRLYASADGYIEQLSLRQGSAVSAYQNLFVIIENKLWWVDANYKETDLARIHKHQPATIRVDMYPKQVFTGEVIGISRSSGDSFSLIPPENASGNWVKVTQRFPVRIRIIPQKKYPLRMGASCSVTIDTRKL